MAMKLIGPNLDLQFFTKIHFLDKVALLGHLLSKGLSLEYRNMILFWSAWSTWTPRLQITIRIGTWSYGLFEFAKDDVHFVSWGVWYSRMNVVIVIIHFFHRSSQLKWSFGATDCIFVSLFSSCMLKRETVTFFLLRSRISVMVDSLIVGPICFSKRTLQSILLKVGLS